MKQYLMPSYGEIMKHALTCKAIGAEVCSSVWCEFVLVKINMNQLGVILYLNMYVCKFEPIQHVFRQKAFCKKSILFHSYTLFYSLQRGQGIFIAINYTHVFSGDPKDVSALFPIADKTIAQLCHENENLLVFPFSIEDSDDKVGEASVMTILNTSDSEKVRITTGNVMGFIGVGNLQIKIKSRFDEGRDDYLLHYMLQKVFSFNLFDLNHNNEKEDVFDFIMFMFPHLLRNAMRQGIYREYQNFKHNDSKLKGTIDWGRHIAQNIPFAGNVAYSTREYTYDNDMTELIRHTIEFMKSKRYGQSVLGLDQEMTIALYRYHA